MVFSRPLLRGHLNRCRIHLRDSKSGSGQIQGCACLAYKVHPFVSPVHVQASNHTNGTLISFSSGVLLFLVAAAVPPPPLPPSPVASVSSSESELEDPSAVASPAAAADEPLVPSAVATAAAAAASFSGWAAVPAGGGKTALGSVIYELAVHYFVCNRSMHTTGGGAGLATTIPCQEWVAIQGIAGIAAMLQWCQPRDSVVTIQGMPRNTGFAHDYRTAAGS